LDALFSGAFTLHRYAFGAAPEGAQLVDGAITHSTALPPLSPREPRRLHPSDVGRRSRRPWGQG